MPFNVNECHLLQVDTKSQKIAYDMNGIKIESVQCIKHLGVTTASNLKLSQQCQAATGKANRILGFINRYFSFKKKAIYVRASPHSTWNMPCNFGDHAIDRTQQT